MNRGDQVEPQAEPALLVAVSTGHDAKSLDRADHMLDSDTNRRMQTVDLALLTAQRLARTGLEGQVCLRTVVLNALVTFVEQARNLTRDVMDMGLEQRQVVYPARRERRGQDLLGLEIYRQLRLDGVVLLLAAVGIFLLFLGRSVGVSLASTAATGVVSGLRWTRSLRLGRWKRSSANTRFSTQRISRLMADSVRPLSTPSCNCVR